MVSQKIQAQFDAIVARRDELKAKKRLTEQERTELEGLEETLDIAPTAAKLEQKLKDLALAKRDVESGNVIIAEDFEAFRRWLRE